MPAPPANNAALLEDRLTLVTWFAGILGYRSNADMLQKLKDADESWGDRCHKTLERVGTEAHDIPPPVWQQLQELDAEIREDWDKVNRRRDNALSLKYFQYLAALSSALFLSRLQDSPEGFLRELSEYANRNSRLEQFSATDALNKLAFWMATGSGKTLLMHMHYYQFMRRPLFKPDNILLITPNEELSRQHAAELEASGIPCFRHGESGGLAQSGGNAVRIIEITKFISSRGKRSKGKGDSVPTEAFAGQNLLFVDEGHKGSGGEEWFVIRDELAKHGDRRGFTFEYSATFGQALSANLLGPGVQPPRQAKDLREYHRAKEYARAILFDYSYRYFHGDGYGKDFSVLNISTDYDEAAADLLMLGNLLSFFQQQWAWENHHNDFAPYGVEKPLLLLLGATVTGGEDILRVLAFLNRIAADKNTIGRAWLVAAVDKLLSGHSGITDSEGRDAFVDRLAGLKDAFPDREKLAAQLRKTLFYADAPGGLRFSPLTQTKNEATLRIGENKPFALVYVGNVRKLRDMAKTAGLAADDDVIQTAMFPAAHLSSSPLNILIGARKFMEGWSSWRVCGMGLLNLGRSEGTQIIQLFGRGVRLKGRDFSLKRSAAGRGRLRGEPPLMKQLSLLETLNIFAIRADFMATFRSYLEREGVSSEPLTIEIEIDKNFAARRDIKTLRFPEAIEFKEPVEMGGAATEDIQIKLDYGLRTQAIASGGGDSDSVGRFDFAAAGGGEGAHFQPETTALLDFDYLYRRLLTEKRLSKRANVLLRRDGLSEILEKYCRVVGSAEILKPDSYGGLRRLHDIAYTALRKYGEKLYYRQLRRWQTKQSDYAPLFENNEPTPSMRENFANYEIRVSVKNENRLKEIRELLEKRGVLLQLEDGALPRIAFDRHLYLPLLREDPDIAILPPGLNPHEEKFVRRLKEYTDAKKAGNKQIFLLRNDGRGKGIGFFEDEGFYPDFILWVIEGKKQRIIFIEPHGMLHALAYEHDFKARLWQELEKLSKQLGKKIKDISLDSYVISVTEYQRLKQRYGEGDWSKDKFKSHHILFFEDGDLIKTIVDSVGNGQ